MLMPKATTQSSKNKSETNKVAPRQKPAEWFIQVSSFYVTWLALLQANALIFKERRGGKPLGVVLEIPMAPFSILTDSSSATRCYL